MEAWSSFFLGELGAGAALAGLLFVSVSVNHTHILELGRTADRGIEALAMMFLVIVTASLPLVPGQPPRLLGGEVLLAASLVMAALIPLQQGYLRDLDPQQRKRSIYLVRGNRLAVAVIGVAGAVLLWRGDLAGVYILPLGIFLNFFAVGANAWVLLIEINR
jgi:modulator of FtsH protease